MCAANRTCREKLWNYNTKPERSQTACNTPAGCRCAIDDNAVSASEADAVGIDQLTTQGAFGDDQRHA